MPRTLDIANDNRPIAFDNAVIAYLPRLRKIAGQFVDRADRDDLVQSTMEAAFKYWRSYNPAKKLGGWLVFQMRHIAYDWRKAVHPQGSDAALGLLSTPADQEDRIKALDVLKAIDGPHAEVMYRLAAGDSVREAADHFGVSRQRIDQKVSAFRKAAMKVAA